MYALLANSETGIARVSATPAQEPMFCIKLLLISRKLLPKVAEKTATRRRLGAPTYGRTDGKTRLVVPLTHLRTDDKTRLVVPL